MVTSVKDSIITRVQKLLNLAMDPGASESERKLAQERADALMAQHMIDQMDLKQDDPNRSRVTSVVWKMAFSYEFSQQIRDLLGAVVNHTTCRASFGTDYSDRETPHHTTVVGTPENIAYAERLWMIVFTELVRNMYPKVDPTMSFDQNVYYFVKAGFKWQKIHELLWDQREDSRWTEFKLNNPFPPEKQSRYGFKRVYGGDGGRLKRAYNRELKRLGETIEHHTSRHSAYRTSYVSSYASTIRNRLFDMREHSIGEVSDRDRYALAVRSSQDETNAEFYRLFPQFDPKHQQEEYDRAHAAEQARRAALSPEERAREDERNRKEEERARRYHEAIRNKQYDSAGWSKGNKVAKNVNLNDDTPIHHSRKELA